MGHFKEIYALPIPTYCLTYRGVLMGFKLTIRLIKHLAILLFISLPLQLLGMVLLAVYLPIHKSRVTRTPSMSIKLPYLLRWFDNADMYVGRDYSTYLGVFHGSTTYLWYWLTIRNPCNYFGYKWLGVIPKDRIQRITYQVKFFIQPDHPYSAEVGDNGGKYPGFLFSEYLIDGKIYYEYYLVKSYEFGGIKKCFRFRLGYKLGNSRELHIGTACQQVLAIQPYKSYSGV